MKFLFNLFLSRNHLTLRILCISGTSTSSTLSLVDLAGSERIDTGLHHKHVLAEEGKKINTSLLHLKNVLRDIRSNVGLYKN